MTDMELISELREVARGSMEGTQVIGSPIMRGGELAARAADALEATTSERDAALAAIELVRVIHTPTLPGYGPKSCEHDGRTWPCPTLAALDGAPEPDDEPCDAEVHSWDHYRPEQIDSYWIRCTMLGKHDEHEDSHTGLKWRSGDLQSG